jgi:hypothetical protein
MLARNSLRGKRQAGEGAGWMPRGQEPKKDAERGETWWGSCMQAMSPPIPNGATPRP